MILDLLHIERYAVIDLFLPDSVCREMVQQLRACEFAESTTVDHKNKVQKTDFRTSKTLLSYQFPAEIQAQLLLVESGIESLLCVSADRWEGWQINRYQEGKYFKPHHDTGLKVNKDNERQYTVILTLQEPGLGGRTAFPVLNVKFPAITGRVLIFNNLNDDGTVNTDMLHSGEAVESGEKIAAVNWIHQKPYR